MMRRVKIWFFVIAMLLCAIGGVWFLVSDRQKKLVSLETSIAQLKSEYVPLRFQIIAREKGRIEAKIKIYDSNGNEIATTRRVLRGESLFLDFVVVQVDERKYITFPKSIFTEAVAAKKGLSLFPLYDKEGFPQIFAAEEMDENLREYFVSSFANLKEGRYPNGSFGNAVHDIKEFKTFEVGLVYRVVSRLKGGLEILEDER